MESLKVRIKELLFQYGITNIKADEFIRIEIRLYVLSMITESILVKDGYSIFTQYFSKLTNHEQSLEIKSFLYRLRLDDYRYSRNGKWKDTLEYYFSCPAEIRKYDVNQSGTLEVITAKYNDDREKLYNIYLNQLPEIHMKSIKNAENEMTYEHKQYSVPIYLQPKYSETLPIYIEKKIIDFDEPIDWNMIIKSMGKTFEDRPKITLKRIKHTKSVSHRLSHCVGALASGKSTYKYAMTYYLGKNKGLRISIIEDTVDSVIKSVKILRNLGIKVAMIVGNTEEKKHLEYYIKQDNYYSISDDYIIAELSGNCTVKCLVYDKTTLNYPCQALHEKDNRVICNYANVCGHLKRYRSIQDAEVIITTPYALVYANIPTSIDQYDRSVYELLHDISDLIIIDEIDNIQSILDKLWINEEKLNYGRNNIMEELEKLNDQLYKKKIFNTNTSTYSYTENCYQLREVVTCGTRILNSFTKTKEYIRNKCLTPFEIYHDIMNQLRNEKGNNKFIRLLDKYMELTDIFNIKKSNIDHPFYELFLKMENVHMTNLKPEDEFRSQLEAFLKSYNVQVLNNNICRFIEQLELLIVITMIDVKLTMLTSEYPFLYAYVHGGVKYLEGEGGYSRLRHLVNEPLVSNLNGYIISHKNEIQINVVHYEGVGRSMVRSWPNLKNEIGRKGPAVIGLSATSVAPGSAHYDVMINPDIILKGKEQGKIEMHYIPKVSNKKFIRISGGNDSERNKNLSFLCNKILLDIRNALETMNGRKALLVVKSYEDCKVVGEALSNRGLTYRIIHEDVNLNSLKKEQLEDFCNLSENADLCIVPLSIISRGLNILNNKKDSYFGSIFFMIRPYMMPGDFSFVIQMLHYYVDNILDKVANKNTNYHEKLDEVRKFSYKSYHEIVNIRYWKNLDANQRLAMSWYMLIPLMQAIDRARRNGNSCLVYFCDYAFHPILDTLEPPSKINSPLYSMQDILKSCIKNEVLKDLYNDFYQAFSFMIEEIQEQYFSEEEQSI